MDTRPKLGALIYRFLRSQLDLWLPSVGLATNCQPHDQLRGAVKVISLLQGGESAYEKNSWESRLRIHTATVQQSSRRGTLSVRAPHCDGPHFNMPAQAVLHRCFIFLQAPTCTRCSRGTAAEHCVECFPISSIFPPYVIFPFRNIVLYLAVFVDSLMCNIDRWQSRSTQHTLQYRLS